MVNIESGLKTLAEMTNSRAQKKVEWQRNILFLSATLFGLIIGLHNNMPHEQLPRYLFAGASVLLVFGIVLMAIASYGHINALDRLRKGYAKKLQDALENGSSKIGDVSTAHILFGICEIAAYIAYMCSLLSFAAYLVVVLI